MDLTNRKEFLKLVADCRKYGIISVKSGDFALELAPQALFPESDYKKKKALESSEDLIPIENTYSDEEILMWSSAGIQEGAQ